MEFPIRCIGFFGPQWLEMLSCDHWLKKEITDAAAKILDSATYMKDTRNNNIFDMIMKTDGESHIQDMSFRNINMADGNVSVDIKMKPDVYYDVLSELTKTQIKNEYELIKTIKELPTKKQEYDTKNGNKSCDRIKAPVPAINMLKTNINVEIAPIGGNKNQADDLIEYIKDNTKDNPQGIWETNIFGKTVEQIVSDGIKEKTHNITPESMEKISGTLEKVMNENTGLVCLIV